MQSPTIRPRRAQDLCLCVAFLALVFTPAAVLAVRGPESPSKFTENRRAADFPPAPKSALEWAGWPRAFEAWHDDHFGLRTALVRAHNIEKIWILGTSPTPRIVLGREGWVFLTGMDLEPWRGGAPFTESELEAWRKCLESRERELAKRGIRYVFALAPSKAAIYTELLPAQYRQGGPSRTDQLIEHLSRTSSFRIVDLRPALLAGKADDKPGDYQYYPLGLHWNDRGGLAGTHAIVAEIAKLFPSVASVGDEIGKLALTDEQGDTWAKRLYVDDLWKQQVWKVELADAATRKLEVDHDWDARVAVVDQADASLPRAVVFHDSFGESLVEMLGRHFSHAVFVWQPGIKLEYVEREKPDVVIQILGDRVLWYLVPQELDASGQDRARERFEGARETLVKLDTATNSPRIQSFGRASVALREEDGGAVACKLDTAAGGFLLPEFRVRSGMQAVARLAFVSPISSTTSFLFQTSDDRTYVRRRQYQFEIHEGLNELYVAFEDPELAGRVLLRPATEPGTFLVRELEVRLAPN